MKTLDHLRESLWLNNQLAIKTDEGFYELYKDKESVKTYEKYIEGNFGTNLPTLERYEWLIEGNFYSKEVLSLYTGDQISSLIELIYSKNFQFQSFMAISKFFNSYALRTDDRSQFLERYEDRIIICALFLAEGDFQFAKELSLAMIEQRYQPATPTFLNAGKKRGGKLVSCFLLEMDDSLNSINYTISTAMQLSKVGGGVAINLSKLRSRGSAIKGILGSASGVLPILKILENVFDYADQLGQRPGAGAAYLNVFHMDVMEFLDCKKINSDEKSRIQTLSLGLLIPDKFLEIAKAGEDFYIFEPYTVRKNYGVHLDEVDFNSQYDVLVKDERIIKKKLSARILLSNIAKTQFESGYPYLIFIDNANATNPLKKIGRISMSNLCTEILQIQQTSVIHDYGVEDEINYDVSCTLGSLNINSLFEQKNFSETVYTAMKALSRVCQLSSIDNAPGVRKANKELRSVGLGAMNFTGFLAKNGICYDSDYAVEFSSSFFALINYHSLVASCRLSKELKMPFKGFEESEYYSGEYFEKYFLEDFSPTSDKVTSLFEGIPFPTVEEWKQLAAEIKTYGLHNAYRLSIAPTQSISYIQNSTPSIQPVVDLMERRLYGDSMTYFPCPFLSASNVFFYKSAYLIDQKKLIDVVAAAQVHIDQGISTVLYVTNNSSTKDLVKLYLYAHKKGLKSLYYTRTKNLEVHECLSCSV